jgi:4-aminobutyrate aminotransferase
MEHRISVKTALPGPKAAAIIERDRELLSPSVTRPYPLVIERGEGCWVEDPDGNRFLDFSSGIAVTSTGHCHPGVVRAITEQASKFLHMSATDFFYDVQIRLARKLCDVTPGQFPKRVYFGNSGAEANESAIKLARYATGRQYIVAFLGAFHGRTMGALSLTASRPVQRKGFAPLLPGVVHVPYPDPYHCPPGWEGEAWAMHCLDLLEEQYFKRSLPPDEVAAVIAEPFQGEGGYIIPPKAAMQRLRELTKKHGILLIADEVQTGMGRTGNMFACQHLGIEPDVITMAKGIASGLPLSAMVARAELWKWPPGAHATTFGGNPVACAAALETIRLLEEGLVENARAVGEHIAGRLTKMMEKFAFVGDVRARGLFIGVEIVSDRKAKTPAKDKVKAIVDKAFARGLLMLTCGESAVRLIPPLCVTKEEANIALGVLEEVFGEVG